MVTIFRHLRLRYVGFNQPQAYILFYFITEAVGTQLEHSGLSMRSRQQVSLNSCLTMKLLSRVQCDPRLSVSLCHVQWCIVTQPESWYLCYRPT